MNVKPLLDFIARYESRGDYGIVFGGARPKPSKPVDRMTVSEVLQWQDEAVAAGSRSSAAGRYQIIRKTLRGLVAEMHLAGGEMFDAAMQDRMAVILLERRGLRDFAAGKISLETFGNLVAMEWASMPVLTAIRGAKANLQPGQSYYAGDGLNASHAPLEGFRAALAAVLEPEPAPPVTSPAVGSVVVGGSVVAAASAAAGIPLDVLVGAAFLLVAAVAAFLIIRRRA